MRKLSEIANEIQKYGKTAKANSRDYPAQQRAAWDIRRREAQDKLGVLETEYAAALQNASVTVVPWGDAAAVAGFAERCREAEVDLTVDANTLYEKVAINIEKTLGKTREWKPVHLEQTLREAQNLAIDIGARETRYEASNAYRQKIVQTHADVLAEVRRVIDLAIGPALAKSFVTQSLIRQAIEKGVSGDTVSVLIL